MNTSTTTAQFDNLARGIIDFFFHPSQAVGGGIVLIAEILLGIFAFAIVVLVVGIIFTYIRISEHNKMATKRDAAKLAAVAAEKKAVNPQWKKVTELAASGNESSYRIAIIDADAILEEMLTAFGIQGETVHEKLKAAFALGGMKTIDAAFEAHGIRNAIAHSGSDFKISEREARRVISLYQKVFEENGII